MSLKMNKVFQYQNGPSPALDHMRILALVGVLLLHLSMVFNSQPWHVKYYDSGRWADVLNFFTTSWVMPTFFVISGIVSRWSLVRQDMGSFVNGKFRRLAIPLIVLGLFLLSPMQVYIERITQGAFIGNFLDFLPQYFNGLYGFGGNFAWMGLHLWYLLILLAFSLILLPFLMIFRELHFPWPLTMVFWFLLPVASEFFLDPTGLGLHDFGGWNLFTYLAMFWLGYQGMSARSFLQHLEDHWLIYSIIGVAGAVLSGVFLSILDLSFSAVLAVRALIPVFLIPGMLALTRRFFDRETKLSAWFKDRGMPFYILHQPVIVLLAFFMRGVSLSGELLFFLLLGLTSMILWATTDFLINPWRPIRMLFGNAKKKLQSNKGKKITPIF